MFYVRYVGILVGLSTAMFYVYVGIWGGGGGGISTLVQMVRPCSIYVGILLGLTTLVHLVRPCSMYHISSNSSRGRLFIFPHQKGAFIRGRRLFQILLTGSRALNTLFYYPDKS